MRLRGQAAKEDVNKGVPSRGQNGKDRVGLELVAQFRGDKVFTQLWQRLQRRRMGKRAGDHWTRNAMQRLQAFSQRSN
jgi:hypothetical protein